MSKFVTIFFILVLIAISMLQTMVKNPEQEYPFSLFTIICSYLDSFVITGDGISWPWRSPLWPGNNPFSSSSSSSFFWGLMFTRIWWNAGTILLFCLFFQKKYGPGSLKSSRKLLLTKCQKLSAMVKKFYLLFLVDWNWPECPSQCTRRCSKTQHHKPCMFFCQKCCRKCLCVPPGYYGNKQVCPCYNNWKTKEGGPKCP